LLDLARKAEFPQERDGGAIGSMADLGRITGQDRRGNLAASCGNRRVVAAPQATSHQRAWGTSRMAADPAAAGTLAQEPVNQGNSPQVISR